MIEADEASKPELKQDVAEFLNSLSLWFDGMSKFISMTKSGWKDAPVGYHLMAQKLSRHTTELKRDAMAISVRISDCAPKEEGDRL